MIEADLAKFLLVTKLSPAFIARNVLASDLGIGIPVSISMFFIEVFGFTDRLLRVDFSMLPLVAR